MTKSKNLVISGLLIAVGIILPFVTSHGMGVPGNVLLPMHIPALLAGLLCGPFYGGLVGALLPVLNCVLTGMPPAYPMLPIMLFELFAYGAVSGLLYHEAGLKKYRFGVYPALLGAMLCGRVLYGTVFYILLLLNSGLKALTVWGAIATGVPGIIIQLILIPAIVMAVESGFRSVRRKSLNSAKNLIRDDSAALVIIKDGEIARSFAGRGVSPAIEALEAGVLKDSLAVDKVIGKATAMILQLGGVKSCHGVVISRAAVEYLKSAGIETEFDECVDYIENRDKTGMCPMEETVKDISDPKEALEAVKNKLRALRNS